MGNVTEFIKHKFLKPSISVKARFQTQPIDKIRNDIDGKQNK